MKSFVIIIPRDQITQFCQAVTDIIEGSTVATAPLGLQKYNVTVRYPEHINPKKFVELGTHFNELLLKEAQEV